MSFTNFHIIIKYVWEVNSKIMWQNIILLFLPSSPRRRSPFRTDSGQITTSHSDTVTPTVHTQQVRSGGNIYDLSGSNLRREINWQFTAFLSLSEQAQYPKGIDNHHFPRIHVPLHYSLILAICATQSQLLEASLNRPYIKISSHADLCLPSGFFSSLFL